MLALLQVQEPSVLLLRPLRVLVLLKKCLEKTYPSHKGPFRVMEDNDPSGYKARGAQEGKTKARIVPVALPPRSPDLNPLDFSLWAEVNRRMRRQEKRWPYQRTESQAQHMARLQRTALNLPKTFIDASIGDLSTRCRRLLSADGFHFEEGS